MKKLSLIVGAVGSGKSRALAKKINESEFGAVLILDIEGLIQKIDIEKNPNVESFESVEELANHIQENGVVTEETLLAIDNGALFLTDKENVEVLKGFNFAKTIVVLQAARNVDLNYANSSAAQEQFLERLGLSQEEVIVDIEVVTN